MYVIAFEIRIAFECGRDSAYNKVMIRKARLFVCVLLLALLPLVILGCNFFQKNPDIASRQTNKEVLRELASNDRNLSCTEYFAMLRLQKPQTIMGALAIIKQSRPKFLESYALAHNSRSLHGSSFEYPRAIVSGGDARMVLTFNGDQNQDGYERMEVMCFDDKTGMFEFRDIAFPKEASSDEALSDLTDAEKLEPFVISPPNRTRTTNCLKCHQTPPRPNWDTYNLWPGFCAGHLQSSHTDHTETTRQCELFDQKNKKLGRYSLLGENIESNEPAFRLGQKLTKLNLIRVGADLGRQKKSLGEIKYTLARVMLCAKLDPIEDRFRIVEGREADVKTVLRKPISKNTRDYLKSNMRNHARKLRAMTNSKIEKIPKYTQTVQTTVDYLKKYYDIEPLNKFEEAGLFDAARTVRETRVLSQLQEILKPLGIDVKNWSMTFGGGHGHEGGSGGFANYDPVPGILFEEYVRNVLPNDTEFKSLLGRELSGSKEVNKKLRAEACKVAQDKAKNEKVIKIPPRGPLQPKVEKTSVTR